MPPITIRAAAQRPGSRSTSQAPAANTAHRMTASGVVPITAVTGAGWTAMTTRVVSAAAAAAAAAARTGVVMPGAGASRRPWPGQAWPAWS